MNLIELKSTFDHMLHIGFYMITAAIAAGCFMNLVCFYKHSDRQAMQERRRKDAAVTEDQRPIPQ